MWCQDSEANSRLSTHRTGPVKRWKQSSQKAHRTAQVAPPCWCFSGHRAPQRSTTRHRLNQRNSNCPFTLRNPWLLLTLVSLTVFPRGKVLGRHVQRWVLLVEYIVFIIYFLKSLIPGQALVSISTIELYNYEKGIEKKRKENSIELRNCGMGTGFGDRLLWLQLQF